MNKPYHILHTEASMGWGGQEIRIFNELQEMHALGHKVFLAASAQSSLFQKAQKLGFVHCIDISFTYGQSFRTIYKLIRFIRTQNIDICVTHSSKDAWLAGLAARAARCRIIRTRHLSSPIKKGLNSILLYNVLSDVTVCTCAEIVPKIQHQARLHPKRVLSIPTGVFSQELLHHQDQREQWRTQVGLDENTIVIGTLCVLRSWKGLEEFMDAAKILIEENLPDTPNIHWLIVGGGDGLGNYQKRWEEISNKNTKLKFTGHVAKPQGLLAAMDIFCLLSTANEGVSQASLQAAFLEKPLICTGTGGLKEVCIHEKTGLTVPPKNAQEVAQAMKKLAKNAKLRREMGKQAKQLVQRNFTFEITMNKTLETYKALLKKV